MPGFKDWYKQHAKKRGLNPNPDDPRHRYDYRAAYKAGARPDSSGHMPSKFKLPGHPRTTVKGKIAGTRVNTRTGKPVPKSTRSALQRKRGRKR